MSDSFFTSRNGFDPQLEHAHPIMCENMIEACARRISKLNGPFEASVRLQRVADICAGAYVLPIEHWSKLEKSPLDAPSTVAAKPIDRIRAWMKMPPNRALVFCCGLLLGIWIGGGNG